MALKGEAKTSYMRAYMRRRRAGTKAEAEAEGLTQGLTPIITQDSLPSIDDLNKSPGAPGTIDHINLVVEGEVTYYLVTLIFNTQLHIVYGPMTIGPGTMAFCRPEAFFQKLLEKGKPAILGDNEPESIVVDFGHVIAVKLNRIDKATADKMLQNVRVNLPFGG